MNVPTDAGRKMILLWSGSALIDPREFCVQFDNPSLVFVFTICLPFSYCSLSKYVWGLFVLKLNLDSVSMISTKKFSSELSILRYSFKFMHLVVFPAYTKCMSDGLRGHKEYWYFLELELQVLGSCVCAESSSKRYQALSALNYYLYYFCEHVC